MTTTHDALDHTVHAPQVLTSGGHQSMYSWQAGGTHPTGMCSCLYVFALEGALRRFCVGLAPINWHFAWLIISDKNILNHPLILIAKCHKKRYLRSILLIFH